MRALPLVASLALGAAVVPAAVARMREVGLARTNDRGMVVAFPTGVLVVAVAVLALAPLALVAGVTGAAIFQPELGPILVYVLGVTMLGLLDDVAGSDGYRRERRHADTERAADAERPPRGLGGHARATLGGRPSTGALKAIGIVGLAMFVLTGRGMGPAEFLLAAVLLALCTNLFNLLDMRPGRSLKVLLILGTALTAASTNLAPLWALGLFVGPLLALLLADLGERGMLGDAGANAAGAVAGLWLVLTLSTLGQAIALAVVALVTIYGEFRSISALIDRTPGLRQLDSIGRARAPRSHA